MNLPDHVVALIEDAHEAWLQYQSGAGSLHDSSTATAEARDALMGWEMSVIYAPVTQPALDEQTRSAAA